MIHYVSQLKVLEMKQIAWAIYLKLKLKIPLYVRMATDPFNPTQVFILHLDELNTSSRYSTKEVSPK